MSGSASKTRASSSDDDGGLFSTRNLIIGGAVLSGVIAAIVAFAYRGSGKKAQPQSKKSKSNKKKKKERGSSRGLGSSSKSKSDSSKKSSKKKEAPKADPSPKKKEVAAVLQTEGAVSNDVLLKFLKLSTEILKKPEMKDACAVIYKSGGNVAEHLQQEQAKLWTKLGVDAQHGVNQLAESLQTGRMNPASNTVLRESLILEEALFNYAYHGNQEAVDKAAARVQMLLARSNLEMKEVYQKYQNDHGGMQKYMTKLMGEYKHITAQLTKQNVTDPMVATEVKAKLTDDKMMVLLKGQTIMAQTQQMMRMMQSGGRGGAQFPGM